MDLKQILVLIIAAVVLSWVGYDIYQEHQAKAAEEAAPQESKEEVLVEVGVNPPKRAVEDMLLALINDDLPRFTTYLPDRMKLYASEIMQGFKAGLGTDAIPEDERWQARNAVYNGIKKAVTVRQDNRAAVTVTLREAPLTFNLELHGKQWVLVMPEAE